MVAAFFPSALKSGHLFRDLSHLPVALRRGWVSWPPGVTGPTPLGWVSHFAVQISPVANHILGFRSGQFTGVPGASIWLTQWVDWLPLGLLHIHRSTRFPCLCPTLILPLTPPSSGNAETVTWRASCLKALHQLAAANSRRSVAPPDSALKLPVRLHHPNGLRHAGRGRSSLVSLTPWD